MNVIKRLSASMSQTGQNANEMVFCYDAVLMVGLVLDAQVVRQTAVAVQGSSLVGEDDDRPKKPNFQRFIPRRATALLSDEFPAHRGEAFLMSPPMADSPALAGSLAPSALSGEHSLQTNKQTDKPTNRENGNRRL